MPQWSQKLHTKVKIPLIIIISVDRADTAGRFVPRQPASTESQQRLTVESFCIKLIYPKPALQKFRPRKPVNNIKFYCRFFLEICWKNNENSNYAKIANGKLFIILRGENILINRLISFYNLLLPGTSDLYSVAMVSIVSIERPLDLHTDLLMSFNNCNQERDYLLS